MNSQNVNSTTLGEPIPPRSMPRRGADGAAHDGRSEEVDLDELLDYRPVPPRRVVTIPVRYRQLGRGRPLPYDVAEDSEE